VEAEGTAPPWRTTPARPEQAEDLAALASAAGVPGWSPASVAAVLRSSEAWALTLLREGDAEPAGMLLARRVLDELEVLIVAVAPRARRRGGGSALVAAALEAARSAGLAQVHLEVRGDNEAALALYLRHGFLAVGRRPRYYEGGEAAVLMTRRLAERPRWATGEGA
jgi:ribosomal-protein-alanine N-acetyltransferase